MTSNNKWFRGELFFVSGRGKLCMGVLFFVEVLGVKGRFRCAKGWCASQCFFGRTVRFGGWISYEHMWRKIMFDQEHPHHWRRKRYTMYTMMIQQILRQGNQEIHFWVISWWNWSPRFTPKATVTTVASPRAAQSLADSDASGPTVVYLAKFLAADLENLALTGVGGWGSFFESASQLVGSISSEKRKEHDVMRCQWRSEWSVHWEHWWNT